MDEQTDVNVVDVTPEKDGGVIKEILRRGEGSATPYLGDEVFVHYVGTLTDGTQFDSSRDRDEKFEFKLGKGNVIKAWDLAVATMTRGELAKITCKPEYAYGENGSPPKIGKNATLIFEVELFDWKGEDISPDKDGSIIRHQIKMGEGYQTPNDGAVVKIHMVGRCEGFVFDERDVGFALGDGHLHNVVPGIDHALLKFKRGEHSILELSASQAYGEAGSRTLNIPPNTDLVYDVILHQFEKAKESWEMNSDEKIEQAQIVKMKGTALFKEEKYTKAITQYKKIVTYLEDESKLTGDAKTERDTLLLAAYLNLAMCHLRLVDYKETRDYCDKALEMDDQNTKALYRRALAFDQQNDHDLAIKDYEKILTIEPDNKATKKQLAVSKQKLKKFLGDQKKRYGGMFAKFAAEDEKNKKNQDRGDGKTEDEEIAEKMDAESKDYISSEDEQVISDS